MRGWSTKSLPNAARCDVCHVACATARRIPAAEPSTQSSRVWLTISMMVGTPRPSSPMGHASAPSNSISADASARPQLVLEPEDGEAWVPAPVRQQPGEEEAREAAGRLGQDQEGIRYRVR